MPRTKKTNTPNDIKQSNLQETVKWSNPKNYKILKYVHNPQLDELYQKWEIKPNNFSSKIDISKFMTEEVVPYNKYFDLNYESAWENKLYNLKVPPNFKYNSITYQDIENGKYLSTNDDKSGNKISITTEKKYLSEVKTLDTFKNLDDLEPNANVNLDWMIKYEHLLIPDLIKQSNDSNWTLATFNNKIKAIRRYIKIMCGDNNELRIKYSVLYGNLDYILKFEIGDNQVGDDGGDLMYMKDLYDIVDALYDRFKIYYDDNWNLKDKNSINEAWKANMNFLSVASMVWDYPSRSDKFDTVIIRNKEEAIDKKTYLVNDGDHLLYWIYKKDIKDIGKPYVLAPFEKNGLEGDQKKLNDAIKLSLKLFPRNYLFGTKNFNWKKNGENPPQAKNVSDWVGNLSKSQKNKNGIETNFLIQRFPKLVNKSMGINLFRRSFVTHWIEKMNNNDKRKMVHAMLTSFAKIDTHYKRKFDTIQQKSSVKLEYIPEKDKNTVNNPITIQDNQQKTTETTKIDIKKPMTGSERQQKYYADKKNDKKFKENREKIELKRTIRELNEGKKIFNKMKKETIEKYKISVKDGKYISSIL